MRDKSVQGLYCCCCCCASTPLSATWRKIGGAVSHSPLLSLEGIGSCSCPTGCVSPAHMLPPALQTPAVGSRNCRCSDPTWFERQEKVAGELFFSPATALLLLLLAVTGATPVLLQGNLLSLSLSLGPGVGGGEQHGDPPPASGGGDAGDLLAAPALAPHHMHQSGLSVAKKAHSNLRVHTREGDLHGGVDGLALVLPGGCSHHLLVHLVAPLPPALGASFKRGGGGGKCHGEEEEGEEEEEKMERGHLHLSCLDLSGRKLRKMENL